MNGIGFRRLPLPEDIPGELYLSSMPGRYRPFEHDLEEAERLGVSLVVCLNPREEIEYKSPRYHEAIANGSHGWRMFEHPIEDFRPPKRDPHFAGFVDEVVTELRQGTRMMLHCAGGIGRTGTVGTCILIGLGLPADDALAQVRAVHAWPENKAQSEFVHWFAGQALSNR